MLSCDIFHRTNGSVCDFLESAPCPPPTMTFTEFRDHSVNRKLNLDEICILAERCKLRGHEVSYDCFQVSTTTRTTTTAKATTDHIFTTVFQVSTVPTTEITSLADTGTTKCGPTCFISIVLVCAVVFTVISAILVVVIRHRRRKTDSKNKHDISEASGIEINTESELSYDKECMKTDIRQPEDTDAEIKQPEDKHFMDSDISLPEDKNSTDTEERQSDDKKCMNVELKQTENEKRTDAENRQPEVKNCMDAEMKQVSDEDFTDAKKGQLEDKI